MNKNKKRITIVFIIDFFATREGVTGGTERQLIETISNLPRSKFDPVLVCLQEFQQVPLWNNLNCEKHILHVYSLLSLKGIISFFSFVKLLKRRRVDIVQTFFFDSTLFGVLAAKIAGIKTIISCRRDMGFWYDKSILLKLSLINRLTKRFLVNSAAIKKNVLQHENVSEGDIDVIYNGINQKAFEALAPKDLSLEYCESFKTNTVVGIVANFNRDVKRVDLFIEVAAEVLKKNKRVNFLIVGGCKQAKQATALESLTIKLGISQSVFFSGKQDNAVPYIKKFDIGVLTSDSEGFSNVIMEYMAASIPVVATDVGGNNELVQHGKTGLLVPKGNIKAIADAICILLKNQELRFKMGKSGFDLIHDKFSWEKKIFEIQNYYQKLVDM
jgi:glycosyltransferase involved in cell wall biosynthesis